MSTAAETERGARRGQTMRRIAVVAAVVLVAGAVVVFREQIQGQLQGFAAWVETLGVWGPVVFVAGYAAAVVAFAPGALLTLAGGLIFGTVAGTLYVMIAATLGACAAFLVSRYLARGWIEQRLAGDARFDAIDRAIAGEGRKIVFLLRLVPFFPFNLLNYALGLTRVRFVDYAVASIGMLPATVVYVYAGSLLGDVASLEARSGADPDRWLRYGLSALGLIALIAVSTVITRTARRALDQAADIEA